MERVEAYDFTGGQTARLAATHFSERQWATLRGLVLESDAELRSQWPFDPVGTADGFVEVGAVDGMLVALDAAGAVWTATAPALGSPGSTVWAVLSDAGTGGGRTLCGMVPLPREDGQGFVTALLVNGVGRTVDAVAVYVDGAGAPAVRSWVDSFPADKTTSGMPKGNVSAMWGDTLVLGDIVWVNQEGTFSASNASRYPHAVWFSQPGQPDRFDVLDVVFTGLKDGKGAPTVVGLEPVEAGLLILTTTGVYMLRGTPSDFEYEEVRAGQGAVSRGAVSWWSASGAVVWVTTSGQLWHTNGSQFLRLDEALGLPAVTSPAAWVAGFDEFVLFGREDRCWVFRSFGEDGAWTELVLPPAGVVGSVRVGPALYALDGAGRVWRLDRTSEARGTIGGLPVTSAVGTRTLEGGDGHQLSLWRRFGVRVQPESATAALSKVTLFAGPVLSDLSPSYQVDVSVGALLERQELLVPGHGVSVEAAVLWEFSGDVTVEQVMAEFLPVRGSR